jgi:hypothetical protein
LFVGVGGFDAANQLGFGRVVGDDGAGAGFEPAFGNFRIIQAQTALCFVGSVTFVTVFGKNGADVAVEVDGGSQSRRAGEEKQDCRESSHYIGYTRNNGRRVW